jgi:hypothetical protein
MKRPLKRQRKERKAQKKETLDTKENGENSKKFAHQNTIRFLCKKNRKGKAQLAITASSHTQGQSYAMLM